MKRITSHEIRALKKIIKDQRDTIAGLRLENAILHSELNESRAQEGKGCLERVIESIGDVVSKFCNVFSELSPEELRALADEITIDDEED